MRRATLLGGLSLVGLGLWLLLDASGDVTLSFAALAPVLAAICGAILLTSGLEDRS
jgi:hypothetical protein